jgi:hypothetical protein
MSETPWGPPAGWGIENKPEKKKVLAEIVSPDQRPSESFRDVGTNERGDLVMVVSVRGTGAITMRAEADENGTLTYKGLAIFNKSEIGFCQELQGGIP